MPKANCTFRISDANRLIAVAKKNRLAKYRIEVEPGKMALVVADPANDSEPEKALANEWNEVR
jgi:hypothetical protein